MKSTVSTVLFAGPHQLSTSTCSLQILFDGTYIKTEVAHMTDKRTMGTSGTSVGVVS